jgi:hypothetical protein
MCIALVTEVSSARSSRRGAGLNHALDPPLQMKPSQGAAKPRRNPRARTLFAIRRRSVSPTTKGNDMTKRTVQLALRLSSGIGDGAKGNSI